MSARTLCARCARPHGHHWEPVVGRAVVTGRYHYAAYQYHGVPDYLDGVDTSRAQEELYDLEADPYQLDNVAGQADHYDVVLDMRARLEDWQEQTGDPVRFSFV